MIASPFDDDHRAVVQVPDPLPRLLARFDHADLNRFARQKDRLQRVGNVVQVDHAHTMQLGHLVQVVVVGDHLAIEMLGQQDQLQVDRLARHVRILVVVDLQIHVGVLAEAVQNVQATAAARAAEPIRTVRNALQLVDHKPRHDQLAVQHLRLHHIRDAAVDDHAGIQNEWLEPFNLFAEFDIGNNKAKIILGLQQHADAGITDTHPQDQHDAVEQPAFGDNGN